MNEQIKELAKQAGLQPYYDKEFIRFAELVAAAEREACAKVCEEKALYFQYDFIAPYDVADSCAEEIRRR